MSKKLKTALHFLLVLIVFQSINAEAQSFADPNWSEKIIASNFDRVLVVVNKPLPVNELKTYKKYPGLDKLYLDALDSFNVNWTTAVREYWKMHKNLEFVSIDELLQIRESLPKAERAKILVLACSGAESGIRFILEKQAQANVSRTIDKDGPSPYLNDHLGVGLYVLEPRIKATSEADKSYYRELSETWKGCLIANACARYNIGHWYPSYADLVFALNNLQELIARRAKDQLFRNTNRKFEPINPALLQNKILLIPELFTLEFNYMTRKLKKDVTEEDIRANYPYPYRLVKRDEIDRVVRAKDGRYAILLQSFWPYVPGAGYSDVFYWAVDAADCKTIISYTDVESPTRYSEFRYTFLDKRIRDLAGQAEKKK